MLRLDAELSSLVTFEDGADCSQPITYLITFEYLIGKLWLLLGRLSGGLAAAAASNKPSLLSVRMDSLLVKCVIAAVLYFAPQDILVGLGAMWVGRNVSNGCLFSSIFIWNLFFCDIWNKSNVRFLWIGRYADNRYNAPKKLANNDLALQQWLAKKGKTADDYVIIPLVSFN